MSIEEKLLELGYGLDRVEYLKGKPLCAIYEKNFKYCYIRACKSLIKDIGNPCVLTVMYEGTGFAHKEVIDNLQQAFNVMQKDLEELKLCQD